MILDCPAKLNLYLAVTGRRDDGFHELVSLVTPISYADRLSVTVTEAAAGFTLTCDEPGLPTGPENLVIKAAQTFAAATGWRGGAAFHLEKCIPSGAGLGGGSSDASGVLRALNELSGVGWGAAELARVAADVGSDCPLFLADGPVIMRGRGEHIAALAPEAAARLIGRRVVVFKPSFGINTGWAYGRLARGAPTSYCPAADAERRLQEWMTDPTADVAAVLFNSFETVAFEKFLGLPVLLDDLQREFGLATAMSGSGSACFALLPADSSDDGAVCEMIRSAWGADTWCAISTLGALESGRAANAS